MFTLCLAFRHAFYYSTAELYQGLALCVLVWAIAFPENPYNSVKKKNIAYFFAAVLIFVISYYHQLTLFPLIFMFLYEMVSGRKFNDRHLIFLFAFTILWFFIRVEFLTTSDYEKGKIPTLHVFAEQFKNIRVLPSYIYFKTYTKGFLIPLVTLNIISLLFLLFRRKWLSLLLIILFNGGFILLNIITYFHGESPLMYENYYTVLGLFCAIPLSELLFNIERKALFWLITTLILLINLEGIYSAHYPFTQKVEYLERITDYGRKMPEKKYIIDSKNFPWQYGWVSWALPFETLLASSIESPDSSVSVCMANPVTQYDSIANWKDIFLGPAWAITWFWTPNLDHHYYALPSGGYKKLTNLQSDSAFKESNFSNHNILITPLQDNIAVNREKYAVIPIRITNESGYKLNAIPVGSNQVFLSYHVYSEKGEVVLWEGHRTSLETDIEKESIQGLIFNSELKKGKYILDIDFVTENVRWWNIDSKVELIVK
jgi:hypothetical protein